EGRRQGRLFPEWMETERMGSPSRGAGAHVKLTGRNLARSSLFATSAIAAVMTMASGAMADPQAAEKTASVSSGAPRRDNPGAAANQVSFKISPQSLNAALPALGSQSGLKVTFDATVPEGLNPKGARGMLTPDRALRKLLSGRGATSPFTDAHTVMVSGKWGAAHAD